MHYPFWDAGIGYGLLMAAIAIVHVFVSHFAIGGGLYLVVAEHAARRDRDHERLEYLEGLSKFFVLLTVVFGALSGVGIWFVIGLLNPAATAMLINTFVWAWAIEWTFFVIEIAAALFYYYGWRRLAPRQHLTLGWIYFASAWMSLFVINGIITFMLTPGEWLTTRDFWDGLFNPTFWPSLVMRTGVCVMLAGLYTNVAASRRPPSGFRVRMIRYNAVWGLVGLAITVPAFGWYFAAIPAPVTDSALLMMPSVLRSIAASLIYAAAIALVLIVFGLILPRRNHVLVAGLALVLGFGWFARFEFFREEVRKPWVVQGIMYGNRAEPARADTYAADGYLGAIRYRTGDDGADLYRHACASCHTMDGYRPLKPAFDGTDAAFIAGCIRGAETIVGNMPPFLGRDDEVELLSEHIYAAVDQRPLNEVYGLDGLALGAKVFEVRCRKCHVFGGLADNRESLVGMTAEEYDELLDELEELVDEMPPFTGDETERAALIQYLLSLDEEVES